MQRHRCHVREASGIGLFPPVEPNKSGRFFVHELGAQFVHLEVTQLSLLGLPLVLPRSCVPPRGNFEFLTPFTLFLPKCLLVNSRRRSDEGPLSARAVAQPILRRRQKDLSRTSFRDKIAVEPGGDVNMRDTRKPRINLLAASIATITAEGGIAARGEELRFAVCAAGEARTG